MLFVLVFFYSCFKVLSPKGCFHNRFFQAGVSLQVFVCCYGCGCVGGHGSVCGCVGGHGSVCGCVGGHGSVCGCVGGHGSVCGCILGHGSDCGCVGGHGSVCGCVGGHVAWWLWLRLCLWLCSW